MGVKRNFIYSSLLTTSSYIFPLIVYPYVSRVLGVTKIGIVNFADSIVNYFILLSMMGITVVGIREIARSKGDRHELDETFNSLICLNALFTCIALAALAASTLCIPQLYEHKELMLIGACKLTANFMLLEWLFSGLENFRFITIRSIIVKALYVVSVFLFVRTEADYAVYYLLTAGVVIVNAIVNIVYSRRFVSLVNSHLPIRTFLKPCLIVGVYTFLTSMYTTFNMAYLGFVASPDEVGYYATATKLFMIIIAFYTAFTNVMLPRLSEIYAKGDMDVFNGYIVKSQHFLIAVAIPIIVVGTVFAPEIVRIIAGKGYEGANLPTQIVMPLIFVIGYSQILVLEVLMPMKQDRSILTNSIVGAVVGVTLNLLLVMQLKAVGSSVVWLVSELFVMSSAQYFVTSKTTIHFPTRLLAKNFVAYVPAALGCWMISCGIEVPPVAKLCLGSAFVGAYMLLAQFCWLRDETLMTYIKNNKTITIWNKSAK